MSKNHSTEELNRNAQNYFDSAPVVDDIAAQQQLSVNSLTAYIEADAFVGNPYSLLGRVMMIRSKDGKCPDGINDAGFITQYAPLPISGILVDEKSKIKQPIKRGSLIVDKGLSVKVGFLNYLSAELNASSKFSIMVFDQVAGLVDVMSPTWMTGLNQWMTNPQNLYFLQDPNVCYLYAIVGIVQKNVVRKKYTKLDAKAGGGAHGINIEGELHSSNEEYNLDIRFGITPVVLKSPTYTIQPPKNKAVESMALIKEMAEPTSSLVDFSLKNSDAISYSLPNESDMKVLSGVKHIEM
ncbi:MAG: hypothetical protein AAFV95_28130 [Bacteroidota bacterium]